MAGDEPMAPRPVCVEAAGIRLSMGRRARRFRNPAMTIASADHDLPDLMASAQNSLADLKAGARLPPRLPATSLPGRGSRSAPSLIWKQCGAWRPSAHQRPRAKSGRLNLTQDQNKAVNSVSDLLKREFGW